MNNATNNYVTQWRWLLALSFGIAAGVTLPGVIMVNPVAAQVPINSAKPINPAKQAKDEAFALFRQGDAASLRQAIERFNQCLQLNQRNQDMPLQSICLLGLGRIHGILGDSQKALDFYHQALSMFRKVGDRDGEATALNNLGLIYKDLGDRPKALSYYSQALSIRRSIGDRAGEASTLNNIGLVYSALGDQQTALDYYNQALPIRRAVGDRAGESITLNNMGAAYRALGEMQKALDYYNQALLISRAVRDRISEATTLNNIGFAYSALGEKQKAIDAYNQILPIFRAIGNPAGVASTMNNIGAVYSSLGESQKALEYFNQALPILRSINNRSQEATMLNNIGVVYRALNEPQKALDYFNQALPILVSVGDRPGEASTLNNIGTLYLDLDQPQKALDYLRRTLPIHRAVGNRAGEASTLSNLGTTYRILGQPKVALTQYKQAISLFQAVGDRPGEAITLSNIALIDRSQNNLTTALKNINAAIQIIESMRGSLKNDSLKTSYFASVQRYYQLKINILMQMHQTQPTQGYAAQAAETADQSRARVLREILVQANANIDKDVPLALREAEKTLNQKLIVQEKQLTQLANQSDQEAQVIRLNQSIVNLYSQLEDLKTRIRQSSPAYANLQYAQPITLKQIQQQLDPDTLILQYSLDEPQSYLWVISKTDLKTYILPARSDIQTTATQLRLDLETDLFNPQSFNPPNFNTQSGLALTQKILAPAAVDLGTKRLVIIPDGDLHLIPFAALNRPNSTTYTPLITQHEITYLPSASTIGILRSTVITKPRGPKKLAILADPIFNKTDDRLIGKSRQPNTNPDSDAQKKPDRTNRDLSFDRLPFTKTEADAILKLIPQADDKTAAFGFDASYNWLTSTQTSQYRYLHLATHGFFDYDNPSLSSIVLSSFDEQGRDRKAFLRLPDIFNLNLPTELVMLSACQTGLGNNVPGEGLIGMTRGFMYAGAMRVGVSLWSVDDQATAELMQQFYQNLWQKNQSHASALRQAQLTMWRQGRAPYYWAAFTLQGEWRN